MLIETECLFIQHGNLKLISRSDSSRSENTFTTSCGHCLEQMVTYGILILWQRNFALFTEKKGIGTQGLKLEIASRGKTRVVNDRGAEYEEGEMNDISSIFAHFC